MEVPSRKLGVERLAHLLGVLELRRVGIEAAISGNIAHASFGTSGWIGEIRPAVALRAMGALQGQGSGVFLFCRGELALATGYTTSVDVTNILTAVAGAGDQTKRRKCDEKDG
jgi:hypothetical protein